MESSSPVQFCKLFADDNQHFESSHTKYPQEAQEVFSRVSELRVALQAFREATARNKDTQAVHPSEPSDTLTAEPSAPEAAEPAVLLRTGEGSVEHDAPVVNLTGDTAVSELITRVVEVVG